MNIENKQKGNVTDTFEQIPSISDLDMYDKRFDYQISSSDIITSAKINGIEITDKSVLDDCLSQIGFDPTKGYYLSEDKLHRNLYNKVVKCPYIVGYMDVDFIEENNLWTNELIRIQAGNKYPDTEGLVEDYKQLGWNGNMHEENMEAWEELRDSDLSDYVDEEEVKQDDN